MQGTSAAEWPHYPFCSERCRLVDLGRWLGESYAIGANVEAEGPVHSDDGRGAS
jgi:endogenous inhibitor of DNA gyrase (YacG/DUF329 family)